MSKSFLGQSNLTRGLRNNNPGNIRYNASNNWLGKVPLSANTDQNKAFEQFSALTYGLRAMMVLLRNYQKQGNNTIQKIVAKYAPANENNVDSYINTVASRTGFSKTVQLNLNDKNTLVTLCKAMVFVEIGSDSSKITDSDYIETFDRYFSNDSNNEPTVYGGLLDEVYIKIKSLFGNAHVKVVVATVLTVVAVFF